MINEIDYAVLGSLVMIIAIVIGLYHQQKKHRLIKRWKKALRLPYHHKNFSRVYHPVNGFILSKQARKDYDSVDYIYGEIEFYPFIALLSLIQFANNTVFYDLGCGTGKAVLATAMVYPCQKSVGIEIFSSLYQCAQVQKRELSTHYGYTHLERCVEFILGDYLQVSFDDATVVFINASTLCEETWAHLANKLATLPHLETVITTTKALSPTLFSLKIKTRLEMSWGTVYAYIHNPKNKLYT